MKNGGEEICYQVESMDSLINEVGKKPDKEFRQCFTGTHATGQRSKNK